MHQRVTAFVSTAFTVLTICNATAMAQDKLIRPQGGGAELAIDAIPRTCPNTFSLGSGRQAPIDASAATAARIAGPTLEIVILGSPQYPAHMMMPSTARLFGVAPRGSRMADVAGIPYAGPEFRCECSSRGLDGYTDCILSFDGKAVAAAAGVPGGGAWVNLNLSWMASGLGYV